MQTSKDAKSLYFTGSRILMFMSFLITHAQIKGVMFLCMLIY